MFSSTFTQGQSHHKCDDHAIDFDSGVVICDGCSGSSYGNVAAAYISYMIATGMSTGHLGLFPDNNIIHQFLKEYGSNLMNIVKPSPLDTTLLLITIHNKLLYLYMLGDGYALIKYKDGTYTFVSIEYTQNMPMYISYLMDEDLSIRYDAADQKKNVTVVLYNPDGSIRNDSEYTMSACSTPFINVLPTSELDVVAIFTDGLGTFPDTVSPKDYALRLVDFKTHTPGMTARRMNTVLREHGKPSDDLSIGVWKNDDEIH